LSGIWGEKRTFEAEDMFLYASTNLDTGLLGRFQRQTMMDVAIVINTKSVVFEK
jgi:hypothetical protein